MSTPARSLCFLFTVLLVFALFAEPAQNPASESEKNPVVRVKVKGEKLSPSRQEDFEKLLAEGKRLYLEEMDNEAALKAFSEAEALARSREQKAEVYFYLSLIHYAASRAGGSGEFDLTVRKLIEIDYYRRLDRLLCPPRYLELFAEIKKEYGVLHVQSSPAGAEVYVDGSGEVFGLTPVDIGHRAGNVSLRLRKGKAEKSDTQRVTAGGEASSPVYKLKKRSPFLAIVGGVALAGGVSALLFFKKKEPVVPKGTIQVNSTPTGAEVFLDGVSTGQTTNCTLTDVEVGSHTIEVAKEGYKNEQRAVVVGDGQTATVSVDLVKHTLTVTEPVGDVIWVMGEQVTIKWETGEGSSGTWASDSLFGVNSVMPSRMEESRFRMGGRIPTREASSAGSSGGRKRRAGGVSGADSANGAQSLPVFSQRMGAGLRDPRHQQAMSWPGSQGSAGRTLGQDSTRPHLSANGEARPQALTNVKIELYRGGTLIATVVESAENSGSYTWTVSTSLQEGTDYRVKVSCADESSVEDGSEPFMITPGYKFLAKWGSQGEADGMFFGRIWGIAISGYIYVTDFEGQRIQKFTTDGTFVTKWGSQGSANGLFEGPAGIDPDSAGNLFVVDAGNHRIQKFTSNGIHLSTWGGPEWENGYFRWPYYIALDSSGNCYVSEQEAHRVQKFTSDGTYITKWGGLGDGDGQFRYPNGLAVDRNGYVYAVDSAHHRIQKFGSNGQFITKWGSFGTGDGEFNWPVDIDIDSAGYIYVTDSVNNRIQKFDSNGKFITKWGTNGWQEGELSDPYGIAIDESGNVYVGDSNNFRVQKFGPNNK